MSDDIYPIDYTILPDDIKKSLPALRSQQDSSDPMVYTKFFCPWGAATQKKTWSPSVVLAGLESSEITISNPKSYLKPFLPTA